MSKRQFITFHSGEQEFVDLKARLGREATDANPKHVIVVVETETRTIGLLVDAVSDILTVTAAEIQPTPDLARDGSAGFMDGIAVLADRMVTILSMDRLIGALVAFPPSPMASAGEAAAA